MIRRRQPAARVFAILTAGVVLGQARTAAQVPAERPPTEPRTTIFDHSAPARWWLSGQLNLIGQSHGVFPSPYEGEHSLKAVAERTLSQVWTVYTGVRLTPQTEILFDVESAGGRGLSDALGLAGFTDLDVVRNPDLGSAPYIARLMVHHTFSLSQEQVKVARGPLSLATSVPIRRLEIRAGKISTVDFFDANASGSDSHLQFMNWTIDNNGAYDYAADTRGYTVGVIVEYDTPGWSVRGAEALMPKVANGIALDWNIARARGENVELELRPAGNVVVRLLGYLNHANMGRYQEAIDAFRAGADARPDIEAHREQGRRKAGVGFNGEYATSRGVRFFGRTGWNDGRNESFAYTEVDDTVQGGGDVAGDRWSRPQDRIGVAGTSNGLSGPHREYLQLGGSGFLLGDGGLHYGRENILEAYYTARVWRGVSASVDVQRVVHPGYNQDRGPVLVSSIRLHVDF